MTPIDKQAILEGVIEIVRSHWSDAESSYFLDMIKNDLGAFLTAQEGECVWCDPPEWKECPFCGKDSAAQEGESRIYLDNFMCAFCNHFGLDASDWDMDTFLDDWLDTAQEGESDNQIAKRKMDKVKAIIEAIEGELTASVEWYSRGVHPATMNAIERILTAQEGESDNQVLYCRKCRTSTLPSGWCGECFGYNGVTKDKLPETDNQIAKRKIWDYVDTVIEKRETKSVYQVRIIDILDWLDKESE